jgi:charged multivesicular body protein 7
VNTSHAEQIMKSYESSTTTLRSILTHPSLQRDKIEETMDALAEANSEARDVGDLIHSGMDATHEVDDLDVEEELQALVREVVGDEKKRADEEAVNKVRDQLNGLKVPPAVPTPPLAKTEDEKVLA